MLHFKNQHSYSQIHLKLQDIRSKIYYIKDMNTKQAHHYENTPMQYTAMFHGCKNVNFQLKNGDIFHIFAQNIDCGYT